MDLSFCLLYITPMKIKTGDMVKVITGKYRGKTGKVVQVFPGEGRVIVEGVNLIKKHIKSRKRGEKGQVLTLPGTVHASNTMVLCPKCGKTTRVAVRIAGDTKVRFCRKCKESF